MCTGNTGRFPPPQLFPILYTYIHKRARGIPKREYARGHARAGEQKLANEFTPSAQHRLYKYKRKQCASDAENYYIEPRGELSREEQDEKLLPRALAEHLKNFLCFQCPVMNISPLLFINNFSSLLLLYVYISLMYAQGEDNDALLLAVYNTRVYIYGTPINS